MEFFNLVGLKGDATLYSIDPDGANFLMPVRVDLLRRISV